jgi:tRNA(Ile)-lysidine synthase
MIEFKFKPNRNYLVACSYGPDSMALLDMVQKSGIKPIVCHVNYHAREESQAEEDALREYCNQRGLTFECLDASKIKVQGNFEAWAREVRYMFFKQMYVKYNADCLFVGHQQDDLIETYLLQKQRNNVVQHYGLKEVSTRQGMKVVRPLLIYTKQDLLDYCKENQVPYSIDVTNFQTKYLRNKIRHDVINKMTEEERDSILNTINDENKELDNFVENLNEKLTIGNELDIRTILAFSPREFGDTLMKFVNQTKKFINLSAGQIQEIRKMCLSTQPNISIQIAKGYYIIKEYDVLVVAKDSDFIPYSYILEKPGILDTKEFYIDFSMGADDRKISLKDYPLTIRSPLAGDEYIVGGNLCYVRRLFIDWKMPARLREMWPVVTSASGKIIYVPRYRKEFVDTHKSVFKIKF